MKILIILLLWILLMNIGFLIGLIDKNNTLKIENKTLKKRIYALEYLN